MRWQTLWLHHITVWVGAIKTPQNESFSHVCKGTADQATNEPSRWSAYSRRNVAGLLMRVVLKQWSNTSGTVGRSGHSHVNWHLSRTINFPPPPAKQISACITNCYYWFQLFVRTFFKLLIFWFRHITCIMKFPNYFLVNIEKFYAYIFNLFVQTVAEDALLVTPVCFGITQFPVFKISGWMNE